MPLELTWRIQALVASKLEKKSENKKTKVAVQARLGGNLGFDDFTIYELVSISKYIFGLYIRSSTGDSVAIERQNPMGGSFVPCGEGQHSLKVILCGKEKINVAQTSTANFLALLQHSF